MSRVYISDEDREDYARQDKERRADRDARWSWSRPTPEEATIEDEDDVDDREQIANDEAEDAERREHDDA